MEKHEANATMEKIVSLCKRRGFIYAGSDIYGGLAGTYDYGPLGVTLKKNIENIWWNMFVEDREDMYGIDAAILMNPGVWESAGHVAGFADPMIDCLNCNARYRTDNLIEGEEYDRFFLEQQKMFNKEGTYGRIENSDKYTGEIPQGFLMAQKIKCAKCKEVKWGVSRQFNMMFATRAGAAEDSSSVVYLRPETAGGMFVNFKNVVDSFHPRLPFGLAQIGKAFRNEITPRDFIFRVRELEQMEIEYFVKPLEWEENFEYWRKQMWDFMGAIGLPQEKVHELEVTGEDLAHYSKRTIDFEYDYPFGRKELYGLAYRGDFDLRSHQDGSKEKLEYFEEATKEKFLPHVIEPSFGVGRTLLAVLTSAYREDTTDPEDVRTYLAFLPKVAPVKIAVFPLLKNKPALVERAREVFDVLRKEFKGVVFDDNGNIGKRYRRQDEIGTPFCVTIDFDTIEGEKEGTVTIRYRDTATQERLTFEELVYKLKNELN